MAEAFNVGVMGTGYVGLVTGACLAHVEERVFCGPISQGETLSGVVREVCSDA